jgi:5-methylcytosine-specific restriction endonuclease McrA
MVGIKLPKITIGSKEPRKRISTKDRLRIAKGSGMRCDKCGVKVNLHTFHVDHKRGNPSSRDITGLQTLCIKHHKEKTKNDAKKRAKLKREGILGKPLKGLKIPKVKI